MEGVDLWEWGAEHEGIVPPSPLPQARVCPFVLKGVPVPQDLGKDGFLDAIDRGLAAIFEKTDLEVDGILADLKLFLRIGPDAEAEPTPVGRLDVDSGGLDGTRDRAVAVPVLCRIQDEAPGGGFITGGFQFPDRGIACSSESFDEESFAKEECGVVEELARCCRAT